MAEYDDEFKKHSVHVALGEFADLLSAISDGESDENALRTIERVSRIGAYVKDRLALADPALSPTSALDTINSQFANINVQLSKFKSNRNAAHLNSATALLDSVLVACAQLVVPLGESAETNLLLVTERFRERGDNAVSQIEDKLASYETKLGELATATNNLTTSASELSAQIKSEKERVDGVIAEFQKTSQEREDNRTNQFTEAMTEYGKQITAIEKKFDNRGAELAAELDQKVQLRETEFKDAATLILDALENSKKKASDLVHVVGNIGVTGNYQKTANDDENAADRFRRGAVACFLFMAGIVVATAFQMNGIGWEGILFRLGAAIIFAFPGAYMAMESSKHRDAANRNRKIELELASLEPFIETLPEEEKIKLKTSLTAKYFGQKHDPAEIKDMMPTAGLVEVLKTLGKWTGDK